MLRAGSTVNKRLAILCLSQLMPEFLKSLFFTETGRDTQIVFFGTLLNIIFGGLFFIFVPRILGPADYGLFSTVIATSIMVANIANFGIDTGILRFANSNQINKILTLAFKSYLVLGIATALIGFFVSPLLSSLLGQEELRDLLRIGFLGIIFILISNFFVAALQARKEFFKASVVNLSSNLTRLFILLVAFYSYSVGLYFLTFLFFFVTIVSALLGKIFLRLKFENQQKNLFKDFFSYNFWVASALIISSIPLDNFFLLKLAGPVQTGLYSAPFKLLTFAYQFGGNFTRVLAPRFTSFDTDKKAIEFIQKAIVFPAIAIIGLIFLIFISNQLIPFLFGNEYLDAVSVFRILTLGFIFFMASTVPSSIILYYFGNSKFSFFATLSRMITFLALLILLVPKMLSVGAAWAYTISELVAFTAMTSFVIIKFNFTKK